MTGRDSRSTFGPSALAAMALTLGSLATAPAHAGLFTVGGGCDYYQGPGDQRTQSVMATAGVNLLVASVSVTGMRFDDDFIGKGSGVTGGIGFSAFPFTTMRLFGTRYIGDESYRAWRIKAGPQIGLPTGQSVGLYYSHYADNGDATSDGASAEVEVPILGGWTGRGAATYATAPGGVRSTQGSLGLAWKPVHMLEISTDVGLAKNGGAAATQPFPSRQGLELPLIGGGSPPPSSSSDIRTGTETTVLAGVRVFFP